jgi:hypothetical protein
MTITKQKVPKDYHDLAKERGYKWIGPEVPNIRTKTGWQCQKGHQWQAIYNNIRKSKRCPICFGRKKKTKDDYTILAQKRGFVYLGPDPKNTSTPYPWRCKVGHEWKAAYRDINKGSGCRKCGIQSRFGNKKNVEPKINPRIVTLTFAGEVMHFDMTEFKHRRPKLGIRITGVERFRKSLDRARIKRDIDKGCLGERHV